MNSNERFRRPEPERTAPRRDWSNLYRSADSWGTSDGAHHRSGVDALRGLFDDVFRAGARLGQEVGEAFGGGGWNQRAAASRAPRRRPAPLEVVIVSRRPVELHFELEPGAESRPIVVRDLREETGRALPPVSARIQGDGDGCRSRLRVEVPEDQPAGSYRGAVVDETTGAEHGAVWVRLGP